MINMVLLLGINAAGFFFAYVQQLHRYYKTKYKPCLYFGVMCFFFVFTSVFAMLIGVVYPADNLFLITLFAHCSTTAGLIGFVFLNMFAISMTRPGENMRGAWISVIPIIILICFEWTSEIFVKGDIGGIPMFTETSMYKAPYGLPIVEIRLALMTVMVVYPIYLFLRGAKDTKDRLIRIKSLLVGIGMIIATAGYAIEITGAIPYQYMFIAIPMVMVGAYIMFFGYDLPRKIERIIAGRAPVSADSVESFIEKFFASPVKPTAQTQPNVFSKALGLDHQQMVGRNILFEFDPASNYEEAIQNFATEALANFEPTVIFTRVGSAIHSSLKEYKATNFFFLTPQVSVPKSLSENEMLLPANDTSLMLDVLNKTLQTHPEARINIVFDSLSDLIMSIGFEKTYRFMRYTNEMLVSPRITVMFLLNQTAHDPKIANSLRGLFSNNISYEKNGIQPIKLFARAS